MFTNILKLSHPILLDRYGMVFKKYSETQVLPLTVLIDSKGRIIYSKDGYDEDTINQLGEVIIYYRNVTMPNGEKGVGVGVKKNATSKTD